MSTDREQQLSAFLADAGLSDARREPLAGDASTRRYMRLHMGGQRLMLMDSPPANEGDPLGASATAAQRLAAGYTAMARLSASRIDAFIAADQYIRSRGLSAPEIIAFDIEGGFCVTEDLGDGLYANLIEQGQDPAPLYAAAIEALAVLQEETPPPEIGEMGVHWPLLTYDNLALRTGADLFVEWLPKLDPRVVIDNQGLADWDGLWRPIRDRAEQGARVFCHRDYHAENLLWLPDRKGPAQAGMVDFQDCVLAHPSWDLHSLLQDARRDVSPQQETASLNQYFQLRPDIDQAEFMQDYTALAALNEARILGIFSRLIVRDGKTRYSAFMPRVWRYLEGNLRHPALADLRAWFDFHVPREVRE